MSEPVEPPRMACGVCARVLDVRTYEGGQIEYVHTSQDGEDHIPVPVDPDVIDTEGRCDFCNTDWPKYVLPASNFEAIPGQVMAGSDWAACETCAGLIQYNQWNALHRRVVASWTARHGVEMLPEVSAHLKTMYGRLRKAITGPLRPI
jgi:hypothetical protein